VSIPCAGLGALELTGPVRAEDRFLTKQHMYRFRRWKVRQHLLTEEARPSRSYPHGTGIAERGVFAGPRRLVLVPSTTWAIAASASRESSHRIVECR
jgi:hypothetical protein